MRRTAPRPASQVRSRRPAFTLARYPVATKLPRASTVVTPSTSVRRVQVKTPPMLSGSAGVTVTLHSPAVEENSIGPPGPLTVNESARSTAVSARLTKDIPERRSRCSPPPDHVTSIGAGGGAQTAGVCIEEKVTSSVRSPESATVATPVRSGLAGPGDPVGLGERVGEGERSSTGGGETLG